MEQASKIPLYPSRLQTQMHKSGKKTLLPVLVTLLSFRSKKKIANSRNCHNFEFVIICDISRCYNISQMDRNWKVVAQFQVSVTHMNGSYHTYE